MCPIIEASSSNPPNMNFDIFISFRGEDVRNNLIGHLEKALCDYGLVVKIFLDNKELLVGDRLGETLEKAIEESRTAIVVLSEKYATSKWCLRELVKIMESMNDDASNRVLPVFYHVDPSHVRNQSGTFKDSFDEYDAEEKYSKDEVKKWRDALTEIGHLVGVVVNKDGPEVDGVNKITNQIFDMLRKPKLVAPDELNYLVDIQNRLSDITNLLDLETNKVRFIGIVGMGGIGKTTIAQVLYDNIAPTLFGYNNSCFLTIPKRDDHMTHHVINVQRLLLSRLLRREITTNILEKSEGANLIKDCLGGRKVLIFLDGVNKKEELEYLAGGFDWFGSGSRIIITTRNKDVFPHPNHQVQVQLYNVKRLDYDTSLSLFCKHAFGGGGNINSDVNFANLSKEIVEKVEGHPQALKQIGSFLNDKDIDIWKEELERLVSFDNKRLSKILKISFDELEEDDSQRAFLDLSCFFNRKSKDRVIEILGYLGYRPHSELKLLCDRFLIEIKKDKIYIHNLIQAMGQQIERDTPQRTRIWLQQEAYNIFGKQHVVEHIKSVVLDNRENQLELETSLFEKMDSLRLLDIENVNLNHPRNFEYLSKDLRLLHWRAYPSQSLPQYFDNAQNLFELLLPFGETKHLWEGPKRFANLKVIDASNSRNLVATPNFDKVLKLERLILSNCTRLKRIDDSIIRLKQLRLVDLTCCISLETSSLKCLESLKKNLSKIELRGLGLERRHQSLLQGVARQPQSPSLTPAQSAMSFTSRVKQLFRQLKL